MKRKTKMSVAVLSTVIALLAITAVTTGSQVSLNTPLYVFRMEQASSEMNFLSTERNNIAYTIENGSTLNYSISEEYCSAKSSPAICLTDQHICSVDVGTCAMVTCASTCPNTCWSTCSDTCENTCGNTCWSTCSDTCGNTCGNTCPSTCWLTCGETCLTC